jgi:hypothetical protein
MCTSLSPHCQYSELSLKQKVTIPVTNCHFQRRFPKPRSQSGPEQDHLSNLRNSAAYAAALVAEKSLKCLVFPPCCKPRIESTPTEHEIYSAPSCSVRSATSVQCNFSAPTSHLHVAGVQCALDRQLSLPPATLFVTLKIAQN